MVSSCLTLNRPHSQSKPETGPFMYLYQFPIKTGNRSFSCIYKNNKIKYTSTSAVYSLPKPNIKQFSDSFCIQLLEQSPDQLRIAMIGRCKRLKVEGDTLDRLTDLPINVKHQIEEHLSIEEAAKMSVLSRAWRHVWSSIPKLVFSAQFCKNKPSEKLIDIINTILSQHDGAIKAFLLNISTIPSSQHSIIDQWMLLLSRNGLMDLTLQNMNKAPYTLPSYMYGVELESLDLSNCIFKPPSSFRGFHKLKSLSLHRVALELDVATSFLWMPNLENLRFMSCSGLHHLKICAPELLLLSFFTSGISNLQIGHFMDCRKLEAVALASQNNQHKVMNLTNLLSGWTKVCRLLLDSYYLKSFASGTEAERFATRLDNLRVLTCHQFNFDDEDQISSLIRMLSASPNLNALLFSLGSKNKGDIEVNVNHFEGPTYRRQGLNTLRKLKIDHFHGSRTELLFVRSILASAPLLLKATLLLDESVHEGQHLKISKELKGFPQASPKLKIICEPLNQTKRVLH